MQSLDSILSSLRWRFKKMSDIVLDFNFLTGNTLKTMASDNLKRCVDDLTLKYEYDIDGPELFIEIEKFKFQASSLIPSFQSATQLDLLTFILQYSLQDYYPNLAVALRIFLTIPVTTASCDRSFSKLKITKNYLRSTMGQSRLTSMSILSIEKNLVNQLSFDDVIDDFAAQKARKVKL